MPTELSLLLCVLLVLLPFVAFDSFVTAGARYVGPAVGPGFEPRPPRCDACGYTLTGLPVESNCPECGLAVRESLPDGRRRPLPCRNAVRGPCRASEILRTTYQVLRSSEFFGRVPVRTHTRHARTYWWSSYLYFVLIGLSCWAGACWLSATPLGNSIDAWAEVALPGVVIVPFVPLVLQLVMMWIACVVGQVFYRIDDWRASATVALYGSAGIWPLMLVITLTNALVRSRLENWGPTVAIPWLGGAPAPLAFTVVASLLVSGIILSVWLWVRRVRRGLRAIRFANC